MGAQEDRGEGKGTQITALSPPSSPSSFAPYRSLLQGPCLPGLPPHGLASLCLYPFTCSSYVHSFLWPGHLFACYVFMYLFLVLWLPVLPSSLPSFATFTLLAPCSHHLLLPLDPL